MSGFFFFPIGLWENRPKAGQWKIFVVASGVIASRKKYFEFRKRPTHFDAFDKSTYRICFKIHLKMQNSHFIKILVNVLMPPANQTQRSIPWRVLLQNNNLNPRESIPRYCNSKAVS